MKFYENHNFCSGKTCIIYYVGNYFLAMSSITIVQNIGQI